MACLQSKEQLYLKSALSLLVPPRDQLTLLHSLDTWLGQHFLIVFAVLSFHYHGLAHLPGDLLHT